MQTKTVRGLLFVGLAAFVPLFFYLAVVGGFLPLAAIAVLAARNLGDASVLWLCLIHLAIYGTLLYGLAGLLTQLLYRVAARHVCLATVSLLVLLCGLGSMPVFGVAHGQIKWQSAYAIYASGALR